MNLINLNRILSHIAHTLFIKVKMIKPELSVCNMRIKNIINYTNYCHTKIILKHSL